MDKDSIFELQKIDANCNDCIHMERDIAKFKEWEQWNQDLQMKEFQAKKDIAFKIAEACDNEKGKQTLLKAANKMTFRFDKAGLIQYGNCNKLNKPVSFLPNICQLYTQGCFTHRKEINN